MPKVKNYVELYDTMKYIYSYSSNKWIVKIKSKSYGIFDNLNDAKMKRNCIIFDNFVKEYNDNNIKNQKNDDNIKNDDNEKNNDNKDNNKKIKKEIKNLNDVIKYENIREYGNNYALNEIKYIYLTYNYKYNVRIKNKSYGVYDTLDEAIFVRNLTMEYLNIYNKNFKCETRCEKYIYKRESSYSVRINGVYYGIFKNFDDAIKKKNSILFNDTKMIQEIDTKMMQEIDTKMTQEIEFENKNIYELDKIQFPVNFN